MNRPARTLLATLTLVALTACSGGGPSPSPTAAPRLPAPAPTDRRPPPSPPTELVLVTHDSFAVSPGHRRVRDADNGDAQGPQGGDAGAMVNQAILTKDNPLADVLFGVDNTFLSRALDAGIFEPYVTPPVSTRCPAALKLDP